MSMKTEKGYLVLGDITGYTSYVATTELEHSQEILTELLQLIIENFQSLFTIVKVEGDAIFACSESVPRGQNVFDLVESTYVNFRKRVQNIVYGTSCDCNACRAIPNLDLKFFIHYGDYVAQNFGGIRDLVGTDVNLIHRLMKNQITELTGWKAYALFTQASIDKIDLPIDTMFKHEESIEHLGSVMTYNLDLHEFYRTFQKKNSIRLTSENSDGNFSYDFNLTPAEVWTLLTDPISRNFEGSDNIWSPAIRPNGKTGIGATNHCAHGNGEISGETILDWQPFEYFTVENKVELDRSSPLDSHLTYEFNPSDDNKTTKVAIYGKLINNSDQELIEQGFPIFKRELTQLFDAISK